MKLKVYQEDGILNVERGGGRYCKSTKKPPKELKTEET